MFFTKRWEGGIYGLDPSSVSLPFMAWFLRWRVGEKLAADGIGAHFLAGFMTFHVNNVQFFSQEVSVMVKWRMTED